MAKVAEVSDRLDRLEQAVSRLAETPVSQQAPRSPGPVPTKPAPSDQKAVAEKPDPGPNARRQIIRDWRVRQVLNGIALLEGPSGLLGVSLGKMVPGVGRVESIMLRGDKWIVATSKGIITTR